MFVLLGFEHLAGFRYYCTMKLWLTMRFTMRFTMRHVRFLTNEIIRVSCGNSDSPEFSRLKTLGVYAFQPAIQEQKSGHLSPRHGRFCIVFAEAPLVWKPHTQSEDCFSLNCQTGNRQAVFFSYFLLHLKEVLSLKLKKFSVGPRAM